MALAIFVLVIFALMFMGALIGEIRGTMNKEQVRLLLEYSLIPLFMTVIFFFPACSMWNREMEPRAN